MNHLLDLSVGSDDAGRVVEAAGAAIGHPLGLVDAAGQALGASPEDAEGQRAVAVARSAVRARVVAPPGWQIVPIAQQRARLGVLAIGEDGPSDDRTRRILAVLPTVLAGQLRRGVLVRRQRAAFVCRLATDPLLTPIRARREAADLGLTLADAYWPGVLGWRDGALTAALAETVEREACALVPGSFATPCAGQLVLLHPVAGDDPGPVEWFSEVVERARRLAPASRAQVIAAERPVELGELGVSVCRLADLRRLGPRAGGDAGVVSAREYALDRLLLASVEPQSAAEFVDEQLGPLIRWDAAHQTDLLRVLEAALDYPRHDEAARACFMHRNTFRHRLRHAVDLLGAPLDSPETRLAVHVAIKLRRAVRSAAVGAAAADRSRSALG